MTYTVPPVYERKAALVKIVDGDSVHIDVDMGCDITVRMSVRLYWINAPEKSEAAGIVARDFVVQWAERYGPQFYLRTVKDRKEKYGRYLADLLPQDGSPSLCTTLLDTGHAVPYLT